MSTPATIQTVGFAGLGAMGQGMAQSLLRAGFTVQGYDINPQAVRALEQAGGQAAPSAAAAAAHADAFVIMVLNAAQADSVLFGVDGAAANLQAGALVILCSTVAPSYTRSLAERLADRGLHLVDAPVSGGTARAADGTLSMMVAAPSPVYERARPLLEGMAAHLYYMGEEAGQGATMKLVNQVLAGVHIAAAAEAIAFGARAGIDPNRIYEVINNSAGASWMFQNRVPHILADDYTPHSAVEIWLKDLGLILDTGKEIALPMPLTAVAQQLYVMAAAAGHSRLDDSAVIKVFESIANFRVLDAVQEQTDSADSSQTAP